MVRSMPSPLGHGDGFDFQQPVADRAVTFHRTLQKIVIPAPGGFAAIHILSRKARRAGIQRLGSRFRGNDE